MRREKLFRPLQTKMRFSTEDVLVNIAKSTLVEFTDLYNILWRGLFCH